MIAGGGRTVSFKLLMKATWKTCSSLTSFIRYHYHAGTVFDKDAIKQMLSTPRFGVLVYLMFSVIVYFLWALPRIKRCLTSCSSSGHLPVFVYTFNGYNCTITTGWTWWRRALLKTLSSFLALPVGYMLTQVTRIISRKKRFFGIGKKCIHCIHVYGYPSCRRSAGAGLYSYCCCTTFLRGYGWRCSVPKRLIITMASLMIPVGGAFIASMKRHSAFNFLGTGQKKLHQVGLEVWMYADMASSADWVIGKGNGENKIPPL